MIDTTLVNSMYPLDYFGLANVTRIKYPDQSWWSSRQRFASVDPNNPTSYLAIENGGQHTSEYLEIDLGRLREINYLNFQVMRSPVDISLEYDAVSGDDGTHNWIGVSKVPDMPFDNVIHFDANARNAWFSAQFYFGDANGNQVSSRFLRLRFKRRPHPWPTNKSNPFRWPISVKSLRTARYIATLKDTIGPLINTGAGDTQIALDINPQKESYEIRQKFQMPSDYMRGDISPALMGFSFEALITATNTGDGFSANPVTLDDVIWKWSLLDSTNPAQSVQLLTGHVNGALNNDRTWIDVFFDPAEPLNPDPAKTYEIRLRSLNTDASDTVYVVTYSVTSPMPGGFQATQIHAGGTTQTLTSQCLSLRVWADIADTGTDVLGNTYRYATRRDEAANVYNNSKIGWMCEPQPSPEAVESLYFDVRIPDPANVNLNIASIVDAFQASPRTQGVRMHFYYTDHGMQNDRPHTRDDWDNMIWTPVNVTYTLRGNQIIELPQSIRASFIKLEFSRLQPYPYRLPEYPKLPNREYHRYPTWIEEQFSNTELKRTVSDWFIKNLTPRRRKIIKDLADPILEFQFKEREFLAALSTGDLSKRFANSQFVDIADKALIDPITGSKLFVDDGSLYKNSLTANVDRSSVLGGLVADRFDPTVPNTVIEAVVNKNSSLTPHVSTSNDRISESFAFLASTPMWFNRKCRHHYKIERAGFNKQAFFVGINQAQFFRKDYTTRRDDSLILDNLHDNNNLEDNTFQFDVGSAIWRALPAFQTQSQQGLTLYITYSINPTYTDEPITFFTPPPPPGSNVSSVEDADSVTLAGTGGAAFNIVVSSQPGGQGTVYQPGTDYDISYGLDPETGATTNIVSISTLASRMVATNFTRKVDVASVVGRAVISSTEQYIAAASGNQEAAVVVGIAVPSAVDTENMVDAAIVTGVAVVHQSGYVDAALVIGVADQATMSNSFEQFIAHGGTNYNDAATVTGVAMPITVDAHDYIDSALVTGVMDLTAVAGSVNTTDFVDPFQSVPSTNSGTGVAMHQGVGLSDAVDTQALFASVPNAHIQSIWVRWASLQPTGPGDLSGFDTVTSNGNTIDNSFDHAKANGYKIALRVSCGCDAPGWLYTGAGGSGAAQVYNRASALTPSAQLQALITAAAADRYFAPNQISKTLPLGSQVVGPNAQQGVVYIPFDLASGVKTGTNVITVNAQVTMASNVRIVVDSGVQLLDRTGSTVGMFQTTGASNWSITVGDQSRNAGYWSFADDVTNLKSRLTHCQDSSNFLIEWMESSQSFQTSSSATAIVPFHSTSTVSPDGTNSPRNFCIRHWKNSGSAAGWGPTQLTSGFNFWCEDIQTIGGTAVRLETDAANAAGVHNFHVKSSYCENGNYSCTLTPHSVNSDHGYIEDIRAVSSHGGLFTGADTAGTFTNITIINGCITAGTTAQDPGTPAGGATFQSLNAVSLNHTISATINVSLIGRSGSFSAGSPGGDLGVTCNTGVAQTQNADTGEQAGTVVSLPVTQLKTIATSGNLGPISVPLPWDAKLLANYQGMLDLLAAKFDPVAASGLTAGGTRRSDYGHFIAVSMPTEIGTEMTMGYGAGASYLPASPATLFGPGGATVTGPITETDLTIKLQGTVTSYVAPMLLKIDSELMYCSAFNSGTKVATVVRGFSGSAVAGHNQATAVTYLDQTAFGAWPITQGTTGSYFGTTGIFEMQTLNKSQWESGGRTLSTNQANLKAAWYSAITATSTHFSTPSGIPCCVAIGSLFIDKYAAAKEIAGATGSKTVWFMTTNLQPGRIVNATQIAAEVAAGNAGAALNDPTRYDTSGTLWPTYYEAWSPVVVDTMNTAAAAGAVIGFQTAGNTVWSTFNTPYAGLTHAFRISLEEALAVFDPVFIELNTTLATTNDPAVAPSTDTTYFYLFGV